MIRIRWRTSVAAALAMTFICMTFICMTFICMEAAVAAGRDRPADSPDPEVVRSHEVRLSDEALKAVCEPITGPESSRLTLKLFEDLTLVATGEESDFSDDGDTVSWQGTAADGSDADVVLTVKNACDAVPDNMVLSATIYLDGRLFTMDSSAPGQVTVAEMKPREGFVEPEVGTAPPLPPGYPVKPGTGQAPKERRQKAPCANKTVDLMALYTPEALAEAGTAADMENKIEHAVNLANTGYRNSGVKLRMRLVRAVEATGYTEPPNMQNPDIGAAKKAWSTVLDQIGNPLDKNLDAAFTERDKDGADLAAVIVSSHPNIGGVAYRPDPPEAAGTGENTDLRNFFSLVGVKDLDSTTLAHESGHNMGLDHDWFTVGASVQGTVSTKYPYNHGYSSPTKKWRSVMAYDIACKGGPCVQLPYFANPGKVYQGEVMGTGTGDPADANISKRPADAVRMLNQFGPVVAGYRAETTPAECAPPGPAAAADLKVTGKAGKLSPGKTGVYTLAVSHSGPDVAARAVLVSKLPSGLTYRNATGAKCTAKGQNVRCELGVVPPGRKVTLAVAVGKKAKGTVANVVTVSSATRDPKAADNRVVLNTKITK